MAQQTSNVFRIALFLSTCIWLGLAGSLQPVTAAAAIAPDVFLLKFVDSATGRPVPLVEIELFNALRLSSDNLGHIAIREPDLDGRKVRILIRGHGYQYPHRDFFGERAATLQVMPGQSATIRLERRCIAERLYRITGSGRYRDTILAGLSGDDEHHSLPGNVVGIDSAVPVIWNNRLFCFWGDALSPWTMNLSGTGGEIMTADAAVPDERLPISYFCSEDGFTRHMIEPATPGFVWIETVVPLVTGPGSNTVLVARYVKHRTLEEAVETGFALFNPRRQQFKPIKTIRSTRHHKSAHAVPVTCDGHRGFCIQPWERVPSDLATFIRPENYQYFSCLRQVNDREKESFSADDGRFYAVDRDRNGRPVFSWRRGGLPFTPALQRNLQKKGLIGPDERWLHLTEIGTGKQLEDFSGSIAWNSYRNRWVMIAQGNTGEIWFSEADTFTGPWIYARKIAEHEGYNFYNPVHHSWFDRDDGRIIYFEGTYTAFFTDKEYKTPRCDYNQVMYRLDLSDPRLILPVPVYRVKLPGNRRTLLTGPEIEQRNLWNSIENIEFMAFATKPSSPHLIPVFDHARPDAAQPDLQLIDNGSAPVFQVLSNDPLAPKDLDMLPELTASAPGTVFRVFKAHRTLTLSPTIRPVTQTLSTTR